MPLLLSLDDDGSAFPLVDVGPPARDPNTPPGPEQEEDGCASNAMVFLDTVRVQTRLGCCAGILTLVKGSRFDCAGATTVVRVTVEGGDVFVRGNRRYVEIGASQVVVHVQKAPGAVYAMSLHTTVPAAAVAGEQFMIQVAQQNAQGTTVGGAAMIYVAD